MYMCLSGSKKTLLFQKIVQAYFIDGSPNSVFVDAYVVLLKAIIL